MAVAAAVRRSMAGGRGRGGGIGWVAPPQVLVVL